MICSMCKMLEDNEFSLEGLHPFVVDNSILKDGVMDVNELVGALLHFRNGHIFESGGKRKVYCLEPNVERGYCGVNGVFLNERGSICISHL